MGYMGFGMQKWIYTRRPRKPFSKRYLSTTNSIDTNSSKDLNTSGRTTKNYINSQDDLHEKLKIDLKQSKRRNTIYLFMALTLVILVSILVFYVKPWNNVKKEELFLNDKKKNSDSNNKRLFDMSMSYGINYYKKGDYPSAIQEFYQAIEYYPENEMAMGFLIRSYVQDCLLNDRNCDKAKKLLDKEIIDNPDRIDYQSYMIRLNNK